MKTVLFICSGNTCRSPLAVAAWQALERENPLPGWMVQSAGTMASSCAPASPHAQSVAQSWDVDLSIHCSQLLTEKLVQSAAHIITMTQSQSNAIEAQFPDAKNKIEVLGRYAATQNKTNAELTSLETLLHSIEAGNGYDILDPFGGSLEEYQICGEQIYQAVAALRESLRMESP